MDGLIQQHFCNECLTWHDDILAGLSALDPEQLSRSHLIDGRFENLYVQTSELPRLEPLLNFIKHYAGQLLQLQESALSIGFWFNIMQPGEKTSLHSHDDFDELLSGVYYLQVPPDSGELIIHHSSQQQRICPEPGLLVCFSPQLEHEVTVNFSNSQRISLAFNIGAV